MQKSPIRQRGQWNNSTNIRKQKKVALLLFNLQQDHFDQTVFSSSSISNYFIQRLNDLLQLNFDVRIWIKTLHPLNHSLIVDNNPGCKTNAYEHIPNIGEAIVWKEHCIEGTPGAQWSKHLSPAPDDYVFNTSCGMLSPSPDTPTDSISKCLHENNIDEIYCVGFALDHFVKKGVLKIRRDMPRLDVYIVLDIARNIHSAATPTTTLETQLRWTFLKICRTKLLHSKFTNRGKKRHLIQSKEHVFETNNHGTPQDKRDNIFELLWHRKHCRVTELPAHEILASIGFFNSEVVNSVDKRCGKSIFHAACEVGDIEIVKLLLGGDSNGQNNSIQPSVIKVKLKSASNLPNADLFGTSDPYAVLMLGESDSKFDWMGTKVHAHRSARVDNQLNPVWEETFVLMASGLKQPMLKINVLDHDVYGADDLLGEVCIKIDKRVSATKSYNLQSSNNKSTITLGWQTVYGAIGLADEQNGKQNIATRNDRNNEVFVDGCVDCTLMTKQGHTPVTLAAKNGCHEVLLLILRSSHANGADLEHYVEAEGGRTPLMYAAINGDLRMVKLLLMFGANPHAKSHYGQTALHFACYGGNKRSIEVIKCLLNAEPDHEHRLAYLGDLDDRGWNAWHMMVRAKLLGRIDWRNILGSSKLSKHVNSTTKTRLTVLHLAAWNCAYDSIRLLLEGRGPNKKRLFPVIHSNFLTSNNYSELDLGITRYLDSNDHQEDAFQCCLALASNGYYAVQRAGAPCEKLLYRLILDCHLPSIHGILRYDENQIKLNTKIIKTIENVRYASKCTFTFTKTTDGCSQIMYYSQSRKANICIVCRDLCYKKESDAGDLIDIGMLDNQVCQCHLTGACNCISIKGDVQLQKLTYVPHPVLIKQSEIQSTKTNRNDLIRLLSEDFHKNVRTDLESHGWSYGSDHDVIKMTDPLIVEYSKLNIGEKEMYIEQAAYVLSLIKIAGYNIVGPLTEEQLESRRSSKFTKFITYGENLTLPQELSPIILCIAKEKHETDAHEKYLAGYRYAPMWMINSRHNEQLDDKMVPFSLLDKVSKEESLFYAAKSISILIKMGYVMIEIDKDAINKIATQKKIEHELNIGKGARHSSVLDTTRQRLLNVCLRNAARTNRVPVIQYLLSNTNAAKNGVDKYNYTPLMYAVKRGNVEAVHALLNAEANCEIRTKQGFTPLMLASYLGHVELVLLFINTGGNILATDNDGMTALHHAVYTHFP